MIVEVTQYLTRSILNHFYQYKTFRTIMTPTIRMTVAVLGATGQQVIPSD
jgi:hypothetical protein